MKYNNITVEYIQDWSGLKTLLRYRVELKYMNNDTVVKIKTLFLEQYGMAKDSTYAYVCITSSCEYELELPRIYK